MTLSSSSLYENISNETFQLFYKEWGIPSVVSQQKLPIAFFKHHVEKYVKWKYYEKLPLSAYYFNSSNCLLKLNLCCLSLGFPLMGL